MQMHNLFILSTLWLSSVAYPKPPLGLFFESDESIVAAGLMEAFAEPFFNRIQKKEPKAIRNEPLTPPVQTQSLKTLASRAKEAASSNGSAKLIKTLIKESHKTKMSFPSGHLNSEFLSFIFWCAVGEIKWSMKPHMLFLFRQMATADMSQVLEKDADPQIIDKMYKVPLPKKITLTLDPEPPCDWWINGQKWDLGTMTVYHGSPVYCTLVCGRLWSQKTVIADEDVHISSNLLPENPNKGETFEAFSQKVLKSVHIKWHLQKRLMVLTLKTRGQRKTQEKLFPLDTPQAADKVGDNLFNFIFNGN